MTTDEMDRPCVTRIALAGVLASSIAVASCGECGSAGSDEATGVARAQSEARAPSPYLPAREPVLVGPRRVPVYDPHGPAPHRHAGSAHVHVAPDHSGMDPSAQQARLRAIGHDFVWVTAHEFVAPDPGVSGIEHMYGVEVYAAEARSGRHPHVLALLPDGELADEDAEPFGRRSSALPELAQRIRDAGGLAVLAHPTRYSPTIDEVAELDDALWGIEGISKATDVDANLEYVDARLTAGRYVCISAGNDIHDEEWSLSRGYMLVSSTDPFPSREGLFAQVRACDFFACTRTKPEQAPIEEPRLEATSEHVRFTVGSPVDRLRIVGRGGHVYASASGTRSLTYVPAGDERYLRTEAIREGGTARCLSQPLWLWQ